VFVPGTPYNAERAFDEAIRAGELSDAWKHASRMAHVSLDRALRLTVLMGAEDDPKAERSARRFLVRFIREQRPPLNQISQLVDALESSARDGFLGEDSRQALSDLADRLANQSTGDWDPNRFPE
jgi:hypothetical protein